MDLSGIQRVVRLSKASCSQHLPVTLSERIEELFREKQVLFYIRSCLNQETRLYIRIGVRIYDIVLYKMCT